MIGPYKLSGYRIDSAKEKLRLTVDRASVIDPNHRRLSRDKMGRDSVSGTGFLISGSEIQETFPKKLACGCIIDTEREY